MNIDRDNEALLNKANNLNVVVNAINVAQLVKAELTGTVLSRIDSEVTNNAFTARLGGLIEGACDVK